MSKATKRIWYQNNKEKTRTRSYQWTKDHPYESKISKRKRKLKHQYGISIEEYDRLLTRQNGGCAICGSPPKTKNLAIDHCHKTGKIRGLLCVSCNVMLGYAKDQPRRLRLGAQYLETHDSD